MKCLVRRKAGLRMTEVKEVCQMKKTLISNREIIIQRNNKEAFYVYVDERQGEEVVRLAVKIRQTRVKVQILGE